jgi:hypothetical protein
MARLLENILCMAVAGLIIYGGTMVVGWLLALLIGPVIMMRY